MQAATLSNFFYYVKLLFEQNIWRFLNQDEDTKYLKILLKIKRNQNFVWNQTKFVWKSEKSYEISE